jgi:uncharacterized membrane protein
MENKLVGSLIIGLSIIIGGIIYLFNHALTTIVDSTCQHGSSCTMYDTISVQTWLSVSIALVILIIGLVIFFIKPKEKIVIKKIKEKKKRMNLKGLEADEKKVIRLLKEESGAIFQKTLMEKMEIGKVKTTRLLDKLEAKQLIERKRRGMNNIVVLK